MELKNLPLDVIVRNPGQPRKSFGENELLDLTQSIREVGVVQPIIVKPFEDKYMIIAGERRWRACGLAELHSVPAIILRGLPSKQEALVRLIENAQRSDLSTMEKARYICSLQDEEGLTQQEIAVALGVKTNRTSVAHYLRLLTLPSEVQGFLETGELSFGHGKALCGIQSELQVETARMAVSQGWTVRRLESYASRARVAPAPSRANSEVAAALARMETGASETVGYPVKIQHSEKKNSGKVMIEYSSLEELDGIMEKMGYSSDY